jgi:hypothetical protein
MAEGCGMSENPFQPGDRVTNGAWKRPGVVLAVHGPFVWVLARSCEELTALTFRHTALTAAPLLNRKRAA